jgi:hypothetical protein
MDAHRLKSRLKNYRLETVGKAAFLPAPATATNRFLGRSKSRRGDRW